MSTPELQSIQENIDDINAQVAELTAERRYWEELGHAAVERMMGLEPQIPTPRIAI